MPSEEFRLSLEQDMVFGQTTSDRPHPPLLTKQETAKLFSTTTRTVDRWLAEQVLPASAKVVIGGSVRFRSEVLLDFISDASAEAKGGEAE